MNNLRILFPSLWQQRPLVFNNPIIFRELTTRLRSRASFFQLMMFLFVMSVGFAYTWFLFTYFRDNPQVNGMMSSRMLFFSMASMQMMAIVLIVPMYAATAISGEKEEDTWEVLRSSPFSLFSIVYGKLISSMVFVWLMIMASLPFYGFFFMFGGVALSDLFYVFLMLSETVLLVGLFGMYCSLTRTRAVYAITSTYFICIFYIIIYPSLRQMLSVVLSFPYWVDLYLGPGTWLQQSNIPTNMFQVTGPLSSLSPRIAHVVMVSLFVLVMLSIILCC